MDILTPAQRLRAMRGNVSRDTRPERLVARMLRRLGIPFRQNATLTIPLGRGQKQVEVDFLVAPRIVLEVYGCFWHCCPRHGRRPMTNAQYWSPKLEANMRRDRLTRRRLARAGYFVRFVWEHDVVGATARMGRVLEEVACRRVRAR